MQLFSNLQKGSKTKKMVFIALLISMALVLSYFERFIPLPMAIPGVKLGLANAITLTALYFLSFKETFFLVAIRVFMNAIFVGNLMSFWYSLSGGLLSFFVMYLLIRLFRNKISTPGVSVAGAFAHIVGQLIIVAIITNSKAVAIAYLPILSISAIITGLIIGVTVKILLTYLNKSLQF